MLRILLITFCVCSIARSARAEELLNASYDPTRELYRQINEKFAAHWQAKTGRTLTVNQSHGGSGKQARAVIDGLEADVVTLALAYDIDAIATKGKMIAPDWQKRLPNHSTPFTSTIVFLVRKGNPKNIHDWPDLARAGVSVITANPKTSGGARWNYLAAWGWAMKKWGDESKARQYVKAVYRNVPVLDSGARGSTTTFVQRELGDVLIAWENEAFLARQEFPEAHFELVVPPMSILAEPPVAVVDENVDRHGTREAADAYLKFLFTAEAQEIGAKNFFRPSDEKVARRFEANFQKLSLFSVEELFGGWAKAQKVHFEDGGTFDEIYLGEK
ncbi:MAG TPA: sulfate ABC transporter substrate-binding protein [Tepidisphaeraceae bacterium]|jgi:sulfate transport system substrate-binding protein